jgi:hypothetical protein
MSEEFIAFSRAHHPAKHRGRVSLLALFYGLFAAPVVWAGNLMVTYALGVHACFAGDHPLDRAIHGFAFAWPVILTCYFVALAVCGSAFYVALRNWAVTGSESEGHVHHLVEKGEGRTRYLSMIGMAFSVLFFCAVLYGIISLAVEPLCAY